MIACDGLFSSVLWGGEWKERKLGEVFVYVFVLEVFVSVFVFVFVARGEAM